MFILTANDLGLMDGLTEDGVSGMVKWDAGLKDGSVVLLLNIPGLSEIQNEYFIMGTITVRNLLKQ